MTDYKAKDKVEDKKPVEPVVEKPKAKAAPIKSSKPAVKKQSVKLVKPAKKVTFSQYAALRQIKVRHRAGMKAFIRNPNLPRTVADWDKCLKGY